MQESEDPVGGKRQDGDSDPAGNQRGISVLQAGEVLAAIDDQPPKAANQSTACMPA